MRRSSCQTFSAHGASSVHIRTGCHLPLVGAAAGATLHARSKALPAASHTCRLQCLPGADQWIYVLRGECCRWSWGSSQKLTCVYFLNSFRFQHLMAGWLNYYNLKCQPVDYSDGPMSKRVRVLRPVTLIGSQSPPRLGGTRRRVLQSVFEFIMQPFLATLINSVSTWFVDKFVGFDLQMIHNHDARLNFKFSQAKFIQTLNEF